VYFGFDEKKKGTRSLKATANVREATPSPQIKPTRPYTTTRHARITSTRRSRTSRCCHGRWWWPRPSARQRAGVGVGVQAKRRHGTAPPQHHQCHGRIGRPGPRGEEARRRTLFVASCAVLAGTRTRTRTCAAGPPVQRPLLIHTHAARPRRGDSRPTRCGGGTGFSRPPDCSRELLGACLIWAKYARPSPPQSSSRV
jgi:hypothetical protein